MEARRGEARREASSRTQRTEEGGLGHLYIYIHTFIHSKYIQKYIHTQCMYIMYILCRVYMICMDLQFIRRWVLMDEASSSCDDLTQPERGEGAPGGAALGRASLSQSTPVQAAARARRGCTTENMGRPLSVLEQNGFALWSWRILAFSIWSCFE